MHSREKSRGLVLGGSGFLGAWVVQRALLAGGDVVCASREPGRSPEFGVGHGRPLAVDVTRQGDLEERLESLDLDWIVNCAALSKLSDCEQQPDLAASINTELPRFLGKHCQGRGIRLLHVSTDLVFDGAPPRSSGYVEEDPCAPLSVYGTSKWRGELAMLDENPAALVVRVPLLLGPSGGRGLGASDSLLAARERDEHVRLFTDEYRTPLDVRLVARALVELCGASVCGLLHVAGPERLSRFELGQLVLAPGSGPSPSRQADLELGAPRPADVSLDASRAAGLLSFSLLSPRITLAGTPHLDAEPWDR
jgi:dTDP-4-dehydrorhamnose reductase